MLRLGLNNKSPTRKAQTAVEYMLLLAVVVSIVLIGFRTFLPRAQTAGNVYFQRTGSSILGNPNPCGDGKCEWYEDANKCCFDCGDCFGTGNSSWQFNFLPP